MLLHLPDTCSANIMWLPLLGRLKKGVDVTGTRTSS